MQNMWNINNQNNMYDINYNQTNKLINYNQNNMYDMYYILNQCNIPAQNKQNGSSWPHHASCIIGSEIKTRMLNTGLCEND